MLKIACVGHVCATLCPIELNNLRIALRYPTYYKGKLNMVKSSHYHEIYNQLLYSTHTRNN